MAPTYDFTRDAIETPAQQQERLRNLSAQNPGVILSNAGDSQRYQAFTPRPDQTTIPEAPPSGVSGTAGAGTVNRVSTNPPAIGAGSSSNSSGNNLASEVSRLRNLGYTDPASIAGALNRTNGTNYSPDQVQGVFGGSGAVSPSEVLTREQYQRQFGAQPVDEARIRENRMREAQAEIDAINAVYNNMTADQRIVNQGNMGSTRAVAARGGTLGSDFGNASLDNQEKRGQKAIDAINAERGLKIQAIFQQVNDSVRDEVRAKKAEALGEANAYKEYLADAQSKARDAAKNLGAQGLSFDELKSQQPQVLDQILKNTGYDEFTLASIMNNNKKAAEKIDYQYKTVGNKVIGYGLNPKTGKIESIEKEIPGFDANLGEYDPTTLPDGTLIFTPKKIDTSKPLKDQVLMYGAEGQYAKSEAPKIPVSAQEYEYAKANGYKGSYQDYQNEDANRKTKSVSTSAKDTAFRQDLNQGRTDLLRGLSFASVKNRIKTLHPEASDAQIEQALGIEFKDRNYWKKVAKEQQQFKGTPDPFAIMNEPITTNTPATAGDLFNSNNGGLSDAEIEALRGL